MSLSLRHLNPSRNEWSDRGFCPTEFPSLSPEFLPTPTISELSPRAASAHRPRFLLLYGSLRKRSFSRFATEEAARILEGFGGECRIFNPAGLPQPDSVEPDHPKVQELRELFMWSEGQVVQP